MFTAFLLPMLQVIKSMPNDVVTTTIAGRMTAQ